MSRTTNYSFQVCKTNIFGTFPYKNVPITFTPIHGSCLFGANLGGVLPNFAETFKATFDYATVGCLWQDLEANGMDFAYWKATCNWAMTNNILVKAHAPVYNLPRLFPKALQGKDPQQIANWLPFLTAVTANLGGYIQFMDTVNEQIHYPLDNPKLAYAQVATQVPRVTQIVNEYGFFNEVGFTKLYADTFLADRMNSAPYGVIGVQVHLPDNGPFDYAVLSIELDKLSKLGKPVHITEVSIPSANAFWTPSLQAKHLELLYNLFWTKDYIEAITYWMFLDGDPVRPTGGISGKPAFDMLQNLIRSWRQTYTTVTDSSGRVNFTNILKGTYKVMVNGKYVKDIDTRVPATTIIIK